MTAEYNWNVLKVVVAQIFQTVGWDSINSAPFELIVDLMQEYLFKISKRTHEYSEVSGRTEPNLKDLGLAFKDMHVNIADLEEYVRNVGSVPCALPVPKLPIPRENHLHFLEPGNEVVAEIAHVQDDLPAIVHETETEVVQMEVPQSTLNKCVLKRSSDPESFNNSMAKRIKLGEETRPPRDIRSVTMTTSGFLSPACKGKLPEARTPHQARPDSPPPSSYPMLPPEPKPDNKREKVVKKVAERLQLDEKKKIKKGVKETSKPDRMKSKPKKENGKLKALKFAEMAPELFSRPVTPKLVLPKSSESPEAVKPSWKVKENKLDSTASSSLSDFKKDLIEQFLFEPDEQKLNILKQFSKLRKNKEKDVTMQQHKYKDLDLRENSPDLIIAEHTDQLPSKADKLADSTVSSSLPELKEDFVDELHFEPDFSNPSNPLVCSPSFAEKQEVLGVMKSKKRKKEKKNKMKKKKDKKKERKDKSDEMKGKGEKEEKKEKVEKIKAKKEKKEKRKKKEKEQKGLEAVPRLILKLGTSSTRSPSPDIGLIRKITIKPLVKVPEKEMEREPSPEVAKISASVTRLCESHVLPLKMESTLSPLQPPTLFYYEGERQVWICPVCSREDDGSPMIGCDDCDAWYHWVCIGMQVPPVSDENWYCSNCLAKKQKQNIHNKKKTKKRKKKEKFPAQ